MKKNITYIKQYWWARILNKFRFNSNDISEIELEEDSWYDNEVDFIWSYPQARIKLNKINSLSLVFKCPVGRQIVIKSKYFSVKKSLKKDKVYTYCIDTKGLQELEIMTTAYTPIKDNRELGLCFYNISDKL